MEFRKIVTITRYAAKATAKETLMYRTVFWTLWEREGMGMIWENGIKTCIISYKK